MAPNAETGRASAEERTIQIPEAEAATSVRPDVEVSAQGLDQVVSNIKAIVVKVGGTMAAGYHAIGAQLLMVEKHGHWIQRCGADSKQAYSSFYQWVQAELGISRDQANDMMAVARLFSAEQVARYGRTHLTLISRAPKELHAGLLASVEAGATTRETKATVTEVKEATDYTRGDDDENLSAPAKERKKKTAKANAKKKKLSQERRKEKARAETKAVQQKRAADLEAAKSAPRDKITIAKLEGQTTVELWAKPDPLKLSERLDAIERAKTIEDAPWGRMDLANGVVMVFSVCRSEDNGALFLQVDTQRESPLGEDTGDDEDTDANTDEDAGG
jgi:hypothetical protein